MFDGTPWIDHGSSSSSDRLVDDPDPNITGNVYRVISSNGTSNFGDNARLALTTPDTKVGIAARYWMPALPASNSKSVSIHFMDTGNDMEYHFSIRPNGSIRFYRGTTVGSRVLVADTVSPVVFAQTWNHLEFWIDTITGEYWAAKEGVEIAALTGTDGSPSGATIGIVSWADSEPGAGSGDDLYMKELVVMNSQGTENNGPFLGPVGFYYQDLVADVSGGWTSTGAARYTEIDDTTPDDVTYISADDTLPTECVFEIEDLPADVVAIRGVMMVSRVKKSDGGDAQVQMAIVSNGDVDSGAAHTMSTSYAYKWDFSEVSPDTGVAWTPTEFNAATFKINRTV
jgi:hypothetical protein